MANAIHATSTGDTLASVSRQYYALEGPPGEVRDVDLKKVTHAIRSATPGLPEALADTGVLHCSADHCRCSATHLDFNID